MRKYILTALILSIISAPVFADEPINGFEDLLNIEEHFYESPSSIPVPEVTTVDNIEEKEQRGLPLFKKTRIKLTNYFREREYKKTQKLLAKEKEKLIEDEHEKEVDEIKEKNEEIQNESTELIGGIKEQVTAKDVQLDADKIDFDEKTMDIIATGNPVLYFPPQDTTIKAEKIIYNNASNILKALGKVEINKGGNLIYGENLQINMNEENAILDNVKTNASFMTVTSRNAQMDGDKIILNNGKMFSENSYIFRFKTKMIGGDRFGRMIIDDDEKSSLYRNAYKSRRCNHKRKKRSRYYYSKKG